MPPKFNTGDAIAYLITWTTYGTWLPGDERGWNRKGEWEHRPPDPLFKEAAAARMKETPFLLAETDRQVVESTAWRNTVAYVAIVYQHETGEKTLH